MLKRFSSPLLSSGVLNSFTQKHHTMHIRESVTGSRFHQIKMQLLFINLNTIRSHVSGKKKKRLKKKFFFPKN